MSLPFAPPLTPMLARLHPEIPREGEWLYEPKWDGFRAIVFIDGADLHIGSRNSQPLHRYFPELHAPLRAAFPAECVVDGEIIIPGERGLDFDALLQRIHPALSRITRLSEETPASFVAFDLLALADLDLRGERFDERRSQLESLTKQTRQTFLTAQTGDPDQAFQWFERFEGAGLDGVVAKRPELAYLPGERAMVKVKHQRSADCVVGGYRLSKDGGGVGSLLLGLYDQGGVLHHVGHTSSFSAPERKELLQTLAPYEGGESFGSGRTPGGPSRWTQGRDMDWIQLQPRLVCEVTFDHLQGDRLRHAAHFRRWRPDKDPRDCDYDQLTPPHPFSLDEVLALGAIKG